MRDKLGRFVKRNISYWKGKINPFMIGNTFSVGRIPWNKGKKGVQICSEETRQKLKKCHKGEKAYNWKGGRRKSSIDYILILKPNHPFCDKMGYVYEHRLVMEQMIGRYLKPSEVVHHINKIRNDNRPKNLELFSNHSQHLKKYHPFPN